MLKFAFALCAMVGLCFAGVDPASSQTVATEPVVSVPAQCTLSQPAQQINSLREAPEIAAEFKRLELAVADVGERYRPFDVINKESENLPSRQFIRAYRFDDRMIGWYLRGGFVVSFHIFELRVPANASGSNPKLSITGKALSGNPCKATQALLDGVTSAQGW
jgi:hypothetical protein